MKRMQTSWLALALAAAPWVAAAATDGEQWEYTGQVDAGGMKMQMPPTKTCVKAGSTPQPQMEKGCIVNQKIGANGGSFSFKCPPPNAMEGDGELHFTADTMSATFKARSEGMTIVTQQTGRKVGRCNAG